MIKSSATDRMCTVRWLNMDVPADSPASAPGSSVEDVSVYEVVAHPQYHYRWGRVGTRGAVGARPKVNRRALVPPCVSTVHPG